MHKSYAIITGLVLFLALVSYPFWSNAGRSNNWEPPVLPDKTVHPECVESREFMRSNHMVMLHQWRDEVVRHEEYVYTNSQGKRYYKSLTKTCLACHDNKEQFCDRCHSSIGVDNYCWDCHLTRPDPADPHLISPDYKNPNAPAPGGEGHHDKLAPIKEALESIGGAH